MRQLLKPCQDSTLDLVKHYDSITSIIDEETQRSIERWSEMSDGASGHESLSDLLPPEEEMEV